MATPDLTVHTFTAPIESLYPGTNWFGVFAPWDLPQRHGSKRVRAVGEFRFGSRSIAFELAFQRFVDRGYYVYVSQKVMKQLGLTLGDTVEVHYRVDDPNRVEVPEELLAALTMEPEADALFQQLTAGRKRGISVYLRGVKDPELRIARAWELIEGLKRNGLSGWPAKGNRDGDSRRAKVR